jgi:SPP1 family predicted phage head-tail adaptor
MANYRAGELDQRVKVMRQSNVSDGIGGNVLSWVEVSEVWCHVRPLSGSERVDFDQVNAEARYLFVVRNGLDVTDSDTLSWDGIGFNIKIRKQPKKRAMYLEIEAERGVAQ